MFPCITSEREAYIQNYNVSKRRQDDLTSRLALLRAQTSEESKQIIIIENECKDSEATIMSLNRTQSEMRVDHAALKAESSRLKDLVAQRTVQLEQSIADRRKLQGQIVNSPDRFRRQIMDVAETLQTEQVH